MNRTLAAALAVLASLTFASCATRTSDSGADALERALAEAYAGASPEHQHRAVQDDAQRTCSGSKFGSVALTPGEAAQIVIQAQTTFKYPASGQLMGDWKKGEALAQNGVGMRLVPGGGDDTTKPNGGNCYACHQIDPKEINHGTLGPSLAGFGSQRGSTPEVQKYVYEKVYNSWAYFPCSSMPRFGHNGFLKPEQIVDVVAYLLDPASPVNVK